MNPVPPGLRAHQGRTVRARIRVAAPPEVVWDAWARAEDIARWFVDRAEGDMRTGATVTWVFEAFDIRLPIEVFAAERPSYLAFGGKAPGRPDALQEVEIHDVGGLSEVRVANSGFPEGPQGDEQYEGVVSGWTLALAQLKHALERYLGEPRTHLMAMRPAALEYERALELYTDRTALETWLARSAQLKPMGRGQRARLELYDGSELAGEVLAVSSREVLLEWPQRRGVLALKAFSMGPSGRCAALDFSGWSLPERERGEVRAFLDAALARLPP